MRRFGIDTGPRFTSTLEQTSKSMPSEKARRVVPRHRRTQRLFTIRERTNTNIEIGVYGLLLVAVIVWPVLPREWNALSLFIIVGGFPALVVAAMISASFMSVVQRHVNSASAWWAAGCGTLSVVLPYVLVTQDLGRAIIATTRTTSFFVDLAVTSLLFMAVTSGVAELRLYARAERR